MTDTQDPVFIRSLAALAFSGTAILDAIETGGGETILFTAGGLAPDRLATTLPRKTEVSIGGATMLHLDGQGALAIKIGTETQKLTPLPHDLELLAGRNVALAFRNGEHLGAVMDWLRYHRRFFGMNGAVIFERAKEDDGFAEALREAIVAEKIDTRVVYVRCAVPMGKAGLPPEQHPFNVAESPGKDRMELPEADPWTSPLGEPLIFEIARQRFLNRARAVASLDLHDLLFPVGGRGTVFDAAQRADSGVVAMHGRHCYPWAVKKGERPEFGDHICVQFDTPKVRSRWCVAPAKLAPDAFWKFTRIANAEAAMPPFPFLRCMGVRHANDKISQIVPKSSLIEAPQLLELMEKAFGHTPQRVPDLDKPKVDYKSNFTTIVTTMKNEGPFILEWLAYHRVIGVEGFLVYTNDCNDGTDTFLELLQEKGYCQHRDNPFKGTDLKPQHAALQASESEELYTKADWLICMDVDEYINVKVGDGTLGDLYGRLPDANLISCTWRLFGNADVHEYEDVPIISIFDRCAEEVTPKPHQAWGFKTLFRNIGLFKKIGVHRPNGLNPQLWDDVRWYNGSGKRMPLNYYRNGWRSSQSTYGYDMVQLNHYAVRSAESFLVKRDRGRVNHVDRDQGLSYWFRMNNNAVQETSIMRLLPHVRAEMDRMLEDPEIRAAHEGCVAAHKAKIAELLETENYTKFYGEITSDRMQTLARMHRHFGQNVFLAGPDSVPDEAIRMDPPQDFFFTVERTETTH